MKRMNGSTKRQCDQALLAPRPGLKERVRPGESALARRAITCSDGGRFSGEPAAACTGPGAGVATGARSGATGAETGSRLARSGGGAPSPRSSRRSRRRATSACDRPAPSF
jgi:hypothetical protein